MLHRTIALCMLLTTSAALAAPPKSPQAWTCDEAAAQLALDAQDPYLQYVALQLARQEEKLPAIVQQIEQQDSRRLWRTGRRADLFDIFAGAAAVQESLQLDTMRGQGAAWLAEAADPAKNTVMVAELKGPQTSSHPWGKMLAAQQVAGKTPELSLLSLCVPEDQYYVEFHSLTKLMEIAAAGDLWADHFASQAGRSARTIAASDRLKAQLAVQTDPLSRPFYDMVVDEVVMTGSDPFFREGSDATMLFAVKQPAVFQPRMDGFLDAAQRSRPDAVRSTGTLLGVTYTAVTTPDRAISCYSAYPRPDLHVRSNSRPALERVLTAIKGQGTVGRLGETDEFKYIRTLMVRGDKREDGFIYLSDPFIRRLVGPQLKLTERRRMVCYNHLRMIGNAAMLYRTQYGQAPASLEEIAEGGCGPYQGDPLGEKNKAPFVCPDGGKYTLSPDGRYGVCSHHGHASHMTPCLENPVARVTPAESKEYADFLAEYSNYWRQYFDPIAIRVQVTPKQYRVETIILPLIDNSVYTGMAQAMGGAPEPLDAMPLPPRNVFTMSLRLNKKDLGGNWNFGLLHEFGLRDAPVLSKDKVAAFFKRGIGNQVSFNIYDASPMVDFNLSGFLGQAMGWFRGGRSNDFAWAAMVISSLNAPCYLAVPVKDEKVVDEFLDDLDQLPAAAARHPDRSFLWMQPDFYKVPIRGSKQQARCVAIDLEGIVKWRFFYARIGKGLYIASKPSILEDLAAAAPSKASPETTTGHAMLRVRPENWKQSLPEYQLGWEENNRLACLNSLGPLSAVARAMTAEKAATAKAGDVHAQADELHAAHFYCPDGGEYVVSPDGRQVACSVHGSATRPQQLAAPAPGSPSGKAMRGFGGATALLTFLEDGLHAVLTVERK